MSLKVLIFGVDSATWDLAGPWIDRGLLPTMARLRERGASSTLRSTVPPSTPLAWTTMMTGKNPGKHGIFNFVRLAGDTYDIVPNTGGDRKAPTLWHYLSQAGLSVGVVNVPFTYPPEPVKGYLISGLDSPALDRSAVYPPGLFNELQRIGTYDVAPVVKGNDCDVNRLNYEIDKKFEVSDCLLSHHPVDVFMVVFMEVDHVQHFFWADRRGRTSTDDLILHTYQRLDAGLAHLLEAHCDDETLILLVSDHGAGPLYKHLNLNRWLADQGWLAFRSEYEGRIGLMRERLQQMRKAARGVARRLLPGGVRGGLRSAIWGNSRVVESSSNRGYARYIDWPRTKAFVWGVEGMIQINRFGREPQGIVAKAEYEPLRTAIIEALRELRDPDTGEQVLEGVWRREELYAGPYIEQAPDIVFLPKDQYQPMRFGHPAVPVFPEGKETMGEVALRTGMHRTEGMLIVAGPNIRMGWHLNDANLEDIAPTLLYWLGQDIPTSMDGRVLLEAFDSAFADANPLTFVDDEDNYNSSITEAYSTRDSLLVEERLRQLGYL